MHDLIATESRPKPSALTRPSTAFHLNSKRVRAVVEGKIVLRSGCGLVAAERVVLDVEGREWKSLLQSATPRELAALIKPVVHSRASRTVGEAMAERAAAYVQALLGLSAWAIGEACRAINNGTAEGIDRTFAPSPAEISHLARRHEAAARVRILEIERLLSAEEEPPEPDEAELRRRAEKVAAASRLIGEIQGKADLRRVMPRLRGESERAAEAREMAASLSPVRDDEIAALKAQLEERP